MIKKIGWVCGLSVASSLGLLAVASLPAFAAKPVAIEKELLGVRVLQNYREVLARYGAPTRIFRATETIKYHEAVSLAGAATGGILGVEDASSSGGPGGSGGPMGGGNPGMSGYPGMMGGGGLMRGGGKGGAAGAGGDSGGAGISGGSGGGGGQSAGDNPDASYGESGGFTWVYLYPFKELAYEFHFNKDGRIERIAELGRSWGQHTTRGIGLGDTLEKVYSVYGWTDSIKEEGTGKFSLLYNDRYHAQFLVNKNRVVGISVFLKENQFMRFDSDAAGGPSGGQGGPGMGSPMMGGSGPRMGGGFTPGNKPRISPSGGGGGKGSGG